jgi:pimeloyl-ACP methyl ester carboxylesterase
VRQTQYVKSGNVSIAYSSTGSGEPTTLYVPGALSNMAFEDMSPTIARFWERASRIGRCVRFDKRGTGLSDRDTTALSLAEQVTDIESVRRAVGADKVALHGLSQGSAVAVLYALEHPERVSHLILAEGIVCDARDPYQPLSQENRLTDWDEFFGRLDDDFADFSRRFARNAVPDAPDGALEGATEFLRATASPATFRALWQGIVGLDLRPRLAELSVPTLVIHARGDQHHPVAHGRFYAEHIPNARYFEIDSRDHVPMWGSEAAGDQTLAAIEEFLTGRVENVAARRFAALLFTDIVDSTAQQQQRGDLAWKGLLDAHHADAQRLVTQFGGRVVELLGDGVLAEFPVPGEALRAARALASAARGQGIRIRAGLHAGEVYEVGNRLLGICVNTASRVAARAGPDEVLATELVRGLVEGSGFTFDPAGEFELKGIGPRQLLRLA